MPTLFDPVEMGALALRNRIIMAPLTRGRATRGAVPTELMVEYYRQRSAAGLIISEATNVSPMAKGYVRTPGIYTSEQIESWRNVTHAVHARGGKIFMQLFHTGRIALPDFLPDHTQPVAPSAVRAAGSAFQRSRIGAISSSRSAALSCSQAGGIGPVGAGFAGLSCAKAGAQHTSSAIAGACKDMDRAWRIVITPWPAWRRRRKAPAWRRSG